MASTGHTDTGGKKLSVKEAIVAAKLDWQVEYGIYLQKIKKASNQVL